MEKQWREAVRFMPEAFVMSYDSLCDRVFGEGKGVSSPMGKRSEVVTGGGELSQVNLNGKAMEYKKLVDRKLRAVGREVEYWMEGKGKERAEVEARHNRKCKGCGKFTESQWHYCAWCGKRSVSRPNDKMSQ